MYVPVVVLLEGDLAPLFERHLQILPIQQIERVFVVDLHERNVEVVGVISAFREFVENALEQ